MINIRKFLVGLRLIPQNTTSVDTAGELRYNSSTDKVEVYNGAVDSIVAEVKASQGAARLKNKDLESTTTKIVDPSDTTKKIGFSTSGNTTGVTTTLAAADTVSHTVTLPAATDTIVARDTTDTLTNKTIAAASNTITGLTNTNLSGSAEISNANLAAMASASTTAGTIKGNITGSAATPSDVPLASANTASSAVYRDGSGNFAAGTITATVTGTSSGNTTITPVNHAVVISGTTNALNTAATSATSGVALVSQGSSADPAFGAVNLAVGAAVTGTLPQGNGGTGFSTYTTGDTIYASASNTLSKLPVGTTNQVLQVIAGIPSWQTAPVGGINYLSANPNAESNSTAGWATYADAAGNIPVNGTGGSPNSTWTASSSTPLRGTYSFLWTKAGSANRQGEGVSYDFTIDPVDRASVISVTFDFTVPSGTFTASNGVTVPLNDGTTTTNAGNSDLEVFIYDVTNSVLIPVTPSVLISNSATSAHFKGIFQSASNSTSYRLIIHTATATTNNFTVKFDNFFVGPQSLAYGPPVSDSAPVTLTPSAGFGTTSLSFMNKARIGDSAFYRGYFKCGTTAVTTASIALDSGFSLDTTKASSASQVWVVGMWNRIRTGATQNISSLDDHGPIFYDGSSATSLFFGFQDGSNTILKANGSTLFATSDGVAFEFKIPIAGWSSNTLMSSDAATRVVAMSVTGNAASASSGNPIIFPTVTFDTNAGYNASTGRYTAPVSGQYVIGGALSAANTGVAVSVYVNAVLRAKVGVTDSSGNGTISGLISVVAGDIIDLRPSATLDEDATATFNLYLIQGPSNIAVQSKLFLQYTGNGGTALTASVTNVDFATKVVDSHNAWSGTTFTAPYSGFFNFSGAILFNANIDAIMYLYVGGTLKLLISSVGNLAHGRYVFGGGWYFNAGETMTIRSDTNGTLTNSASAHWISITSQG